jgi:hypothetical protein
MEGEAQFTLNNPESIEGSEPSRGTDLRGPSRLARRLALQGPITLPRARPRGR